MKSITIHGVDDQMVKLLQQAAREHSTSVNRTIKRLLEEALGLKPRPAGTNRKVFAEFLGVWTEAELADFTAATADLAVVDEDDWR